MTQHLDCACRTQQGEAGDEQPEFLPMFPWYSGESPANHDILAPCSLFTCCHGSEICLAMLHVQ